MSLSVFVLDPSRAADEVVDWGFGADTALVAGHLAGPQVAARLRETSGEDPHLVLLHRPAQAADAAFLANVVSGAVPAVPVSRLQVDSSLLAATVIGLEAAHVEGEGDVSRLARIEHTLARGVGGAWLKRVTRLDSPSPSFGQHLRSIVPGGARFVARCGTEGRVERASAGGYTAQGEEQLVVGAEADHPGARQLAAWFGSDDVVHVPPVTSDAKRLYGNPGVEFVVVREVLEPPGPGRGRCRVCRDTLHAEVCPYCHVRSQPLEVPSA
ncbi:hypothetical protein [Phycicoccus flavus]|uniref:hypothetical protein n=1 Tax=Phycicoccus flavus TaxID=2502783 RepID=UPI000FEC0380|nr:hypothetical protein [Phycicoccus flavus]NHA69465.1 hypothetical protein [Phycicoccus flavus]